MFSFIFIKLLLILPEICIVFALFVLNACPSPAFVVGFVWRHVWKGRLLLGEVAVRCH